MRLSLHATAGAATGPLGRARQAHEGCSLFGESFTPSSMQYSKVTKSRGAACR
jgi:hypothetical protein